MKPATLKLIEVSSPAYLHSCDAGALLKARLSDSEWDKYGRESMQDLVDVLAYKNGFHAFESALRFFPAIDSTAIDGILSWNHPDLWKFEYGNLASDFLFFASDVFGGQFGIKEEKIYHFDPETADAELVSDTIDGWAETILLKYRSLTGFPLARRWQTENGALSIREVLFPKKPFVLGGEYSLTNLVALDSVRAMKNYANLARQIHELPDGSKIELHIAKKM